MPLIPHCDDCSAQILNVSPGDEAILRYQLLIDSRRFIFCSIVCLQNGLQKRYGPRLRLVASE